MTHTTKWTMFLVIGFCTVIHAQPLPQNQLTSPSATNNKAERTRLVRGQAVVVQELVMGPEATELWRKIQQLIVEPELKDLSKLMQTFDLKITEPMDLVDWTKSGSVHRRDITSSKRLVTKGRYGMFDETKTRNRRILYLDFEFDISQFCLTKPEIQRLYATGWESAPVHSPQFLWDDKTGTDHSFPLSNAKASFRVSAGGCITEYGATQILENTNEGITK